MSLPGLGRAGSSLEATPSRGGTPQRNQGIPGLAFGHSGISDAGSRAPSQGPITSRQHSEGATVKQTAPVATAPGTSFDMEDGEISEDFEDLYDTDEGETQQVANAQKTGDGDAGERDRSGSYSPYLSPREVDTPPSNHNSPSKVQTLRHSHEDVANKAKAMMDGSKIEAQTAIIRLNHANVSYSDFIKEGIDSKILSSLFRELGIEVPIAPATAVAAKVANPPKMPTPAKAAKPMPAKDEKLNTDGAESRKDRIARLLAEKKKDADAKPPPTAAAAPKAPTAKSSEKSKLLQQKMEALIKAREALQNDRSKTWGSTEPDASPSNQPQDSISLDDSRKRQASSTQADDSKLSSKRPFGEHRASRPLLIDVSEDEDEEMAHGSSDRVAYRIDVERHNTGLSSSAQTPLSGHGAPSDNEELLSMNKKIEAMKQRIAEAEARKKARDLLNEVSDLHQTPRSTTDSTAPSASATPDIKSPQMTTKKSTESSPRNQDRRERATSEKSAAAEAHRKEKQLRLQLLQSQVALLQKEIDDSEVKDDEEDADEEDANDDDDEDDDEEEEEHKVSHPAPVSNSASVSDTNKDKQQSSISNTGGDAQEKAPGAATEDSSEESDEEDSSEEDDSDADEGEAVMQTASNNDADEPTDSDVEMESSNEPAKASDEIEPEDVLGQVEMTDADTDGVAGDVDALIGPETILSSRQIPSASRDHSTEPAREEEEPTLSMPSGSSFAPYETPLHYFRAYRFHPEYQRNVTTGLRSLTYSNKIDVKTPMCPDETAGRPCPRGTECDFQHFTSLQAPDDQILLQLGAYEGLGADGKEEYIAGLKALLTDFRNRKVKDFDTISQGIVEYRTKFQNDKKPFPQLLASKK